jgi:drug/metabolite transporter (DMT)-like permease
MAFFLFGQLPSSVFVIGAMIAIVGVILTQKG